MTDRRFEIGEADLRAAMAQELAMFPPSQQYVAELAMKYLIGCVIARARAKEQEKS